MPLLDPNQPPTGRRTRRIALVLAAALPVAAYLFLSVIGSMDSFRRRLEDAASAAAGSQVQISKVRVGYDLGLHLSNLSASGPAGNPFLTVEHAAAYLSPRGLLSGHPITISLDSPRIFVDRLPASGGTGGEPALPFHRVRIEGGYFVTADDEVGPITVTLDAVQTGQEANATMLIDPRLPPLDVVAAIDTSGGGLRFSTLQLDWKNVPLTIVRERFPTVATAAIDGTLDLSAHVSGRLQELTGSGSLRVQGLRYQTGSAELAGDIDAPFTLDGRRVTLAEPGLKLNGATWSAAGLNGSAAAATLTGAIDLEDDGVHATGNVSVDKLQGRDASSERAIENVVVGGTLDGHWRSAAPAAIRISLTAATGELLWIPIYADISRHPLTVTCDVSPVAQGFKLDRIEAVAKGLGRLKGDAILGATAAIERADAQIEVSDLDDFYAVAVRDAYKESYPALANTKVGGRMSLQIAYVRSDSDFGITGNLRLTDTTISSTDPLFEARGVQLDVPLALGAVKEVAPRAGRLGIAGMLLGDIAVGEVNGKLHVRANTVDLAEPLSMELLGGTLQIDELALEKVAAADRQAQMGVTIRNLDLEGLTKNLGLPVFRGTMSGAIPRVTATSSELRSEGEIRIRAFDGDMTVRNFSVDQLFSSVPTLGFDMDFEEISLTRLTETLEIGKISGVARGAAHGLKIVNGEPLSFDAWMETVERPGVPQRVSVSAIRQLSILGGSGGDPFSQGVLGFFDEYRYAKMGFKCRLENDRFLLRGVETIDGKEYLVVGSRLPPRVDVVSHTQVISFSEMVRRLQRVTAAKAAEEKKGESQ